MCSLSFTLNSKFSALQIFKAIAAWADATKKDLKTTCIPPLYLCRHYCYSCATIDFPLCFCIMVSNQKSNSYWEGLDGNNARQYDTLSVINVLCDGNILNYITFTGIFHELDH